ncbi:hypothetical protein [Pontibacter amylolyticus]|uniref:Uncharacterized protein n=1 Tax=Pontibacter amylolyticus TaxID=1424080 RepID=A0ABQ1VX79_9BACT|nr:hypothetical protein [Pontibacter amylolyticus]GGG03622.1 hypothetical protein GCM10011323_05570 [Pontibacter amylolyticus]
MRWTLVLLLLLSACATQRQTGADEEAIPAAGKRVPKLYAPAIYAKPTISPARSALSPQEATGGNFYATRPSGRSPIPAASRTAIPSATAPGRVKTRTVYLRDTLALDSLSRELQIEQLANQAMRGRLKSTESERDYWQDKNEQKFWTLIAMAVFAFLYILFRVLASRIKET